MGTQMRMTERPPSRHQSGAITKAWRDFGGIAQYQENGERETRLDEGRKQLVDCWLPFSLRQLSQRERRSYHARQDRTDEQAPPLCAILHASQTTQQPLLELTFSTQASFATLPHVCPQKRSIECAAAKQTPTRTNRGLSTCLQNASKAD